MGRDRETEPPSTKITQMLLSNKGYCFHHVLLGCFGFLQRLVIEDYESFIPKPQRGDICVETRSPCLKPQRGDICIPFPRIIKQNSIQISTIYFVATYLKTVN